MSLAKTYEACLELFKRWSWDRKFSPVVAVGMTVATAMKQLKGVPNVIVHGGAASGKTALLGAVGKLVEREPSETRFDIGVTRASLLELARLDLAAIAIDGDISDVSLFRSMRRGSINMLDASSRSVVDCPYVAWISHCDGIGFYDRNMLVLLPVVPPVLSSATFVDEVAARAAELNPHVARVAGEILPAVQQRLTWIRSEVLGEISALLLRSADLHAIPVAVVAAMLELSNDETEKLLVGVAHEEIGWLPDVETYIPA